MVNLRCKTEVAADHLILLLYNSEYFERRWHAIRIFILFSVIQLSWLLGFEVIHVHFLPFGSRFVFC